jgi:DNA-binding Xre family transcriptional regulator
MTLEKQLDKLKKEVTKRLYDLFMAKYQGNKLRFAKDAKCDEKAIRLLFDEGQGMTLNLLLKLCYTLNISPSELLKDIEIKKE